MISLGPKVFAVDPSLTSTGWCLADIEDRSMTVHGVGRIIPPANGTVRSRSRNLARRIEEVIHANKHVRDYGDLSVVIEVPSSRASDRHQGHGFGLAVFGLSVGIVLGRLIEAVGSKHVIDVDANVWTGSRSKKARRDIALRHYPALADIKDPGMDVSDAVALAVWWAQVGRHKKASA